MNLNQTDLDSDPPDAEPAPGRFPAWAKPPILMYATMVAAFAIAGIFVIYYVMRITQPGK